MITLEILLASFTVLWTAIDPVGTLPVFIAFTKGYSDKDRLKIARYANFVAFGVLTFFLVIGEVVLKYAGVPLSAFQTSGGIVLFLIALNMIFGSSKPEDELELMKSTKETAIFPLAIPSIAGPGAILSIVLLTDNSRHSIFEQAATWIVMALILFINYMMMHFSKPIHSKIGDAGAIIVSKVMGLILASVALNNVLVGLKTFFNLS